MTAAQVAASAVAAIAQLRHVRTARELQAVLAVERRFAEPDIRAALVYVQEQLGAKLAQADYRRELFTRGYVDPVVHPEMVLCHWFNETGTMVAGGLLDEDVFLDSFGRLIVFYWALLVPVVALLRRERDADQYRHFEQLATRAAAWRERYPAGMYPRSARRLTVVDPWGDVDAVGRAE
jgi:hypothetical protein